VCKAFSGLNYKIAQNYLTYMLNYIVMQMTKVDCENGYFAHSRSEKKLVIIVLSNLSGNPLAVYTLHSKVLDTSLLKNLISISISYNHGSHRHKCGKTVMQGKLLKTGLTFIILFSRNMESSHIRHS